MKPVFDFVQGKLSYDEFQVEFVLHPEIWAWVQQLVPKNIADINCPFRALYHNMQGFETNNFNVRATIMTFGYDDIYGRSIAHSLISALVKYHYPEIVSRKPPEQSSDDVLEAIGLDYIGGVEVDDIVKNIIWAYQKDGKTAIKRALKDAFHISSRKHPTWVQEPEWPAINGKPMKFISQKNDGDKFMFEFQEPDANQIRIIVQYA